MRIAIITLPLHTNYGGILQAYALRDTLVRLGHQADVVDRKVKILMPPAWKMPLVYAKRAFLNLVSFGKGPEIFRERRIIKEHPVVSAQVSRFIDSRISPRLVGGYSELQVGEYDAFVVGSDQVWRPKYFGQIEDAFLEFAREWNVKRVAYAASFGTGQLEYTYQQLETCSRLLKEFDGVSVRESGAVGICDEWFDYEDAVHVLDPVMLLTAEDYHRLASAASARPAKGKALKYIMDPRPEKTAVSDRVASWFAGGMHDASVFPRDISLPLEDRVAPPMEQWLSCFEDCGFVVTDSFHACVMAILFHKPFIVLGNPQRGMSRILSLLETFGLEDRLVHGLDPDDDGEYYMSDPDWKAVDEILEKKRNESKDFLVKSL